MFVDKHTLSVSFIVNWVNTPVGPESEKQKASSHTVQSQLVMEPENPEVIVPFNCNVPPKPETIV